MKKLFVSLFALMIISVSFANVRLDSMLLQNGELKDVIGDYLYSPTFFPEQNMVIYVGNSDNIFSNEKNVYTDGNNWINTDYSKNTEDNYLFNMLFIAKLKNFVFGLNYNPVFKSADNNVKTIRYFKNTSTYFINEQTLYTNSSNLNRFNLTAGMNMNKFNVGLKFGIIAGADTETNQYTDFTNSSNDTVDGMKFTTGNMSISPDVLFKLSFGRILASFNIISVSNKGEENWDGTAYLSSYKETGLNFMPKLFYSNKFSFGVIRFGFTFGTENLKREYTYDASLAENTWDYSNKTSGVSSFVTYTKYYKRSVITGGFRLSTLKVENLYKQDKDTSDAAYQDYTINSNGSTFGLILAFEQHLNRFLTFFGGVNWDASNSLSTNILVKDETDAVVSNDTENIDKPAFNYGLGISIRFWQIGSLNFSFSTIADGFVNYDDKVDELALNNTNTSDEKRFTFYFDFVR